MAHKKSLEALDRIMNDLLNNQNRFGEAIILLSGDFRHTLPVDELNALLTDFANSFFVVLVIVRRRFL